MTAAELRAALETLGWSARELANRLGCHRNLVVEWLDENRPKQVPEAIAAWLREAVAWFAGHPPPAWRVRAVA